MAAPLAPSPSGAARYAPDLQVFVFALFFAFGGITSLNDVLIPKLKELFTLTYAEAMLVQSAYFAAYFIVSMPAALLVQRIGYMRSAVAGLGIMALGCLLFIPASAHSLFSLFLIALFVLAAGVTTVQVVANPLISMLGPAATTSSRLTFAQAFNSLGTTVFPYVGSILILGAIAKVDPKSLSGDALSRFVSQETGIIAHTYLGLAGAVSLLAAVVWWRRKALVEAPDDHASLSQGFKLLKRPRFAFGTLCIFLYVGAEVAIGSTIVNYLMQSNILGLGAEAAGKHIQFYWGGAMLGRFIGASVLRLFAPYKVLGAVAATAIGLLLISANSGGALAAWTLLAVGLFNSVMFPTIFSLASEGLGKRAAEGSGVICMAIVGGAVVPLITGKTADHFGLQQALIVPAVCYCGILLYGWYARNPVTAL